MRWQRLIDSGVCVGIKYAVVRDDPSQDKYLEGLLSRVDRSKVISGIGERPAIVPSARFRAERLHHRLRLRRAAAQ